jgi:hypothetical protein
MRNSLLEFSPKRVFKSISSRQTNSPARAIVAFVPSKNDDRRKSGASSHPSLRAVLFTRRRFSTSRHHQTAKREGEENEAGTKARFRRI